jgi:hypothetical protein
MLQLTHGRPLQVVLWYQGKEHHLLPWILTEPDNWAITMFASQLPITVKHWHLPVLRFRLRTV